MESKIELISSIGKIVVFLMLLLSVFLFTVKTKKKLSNSLFAIYLLLIAFDLIGLFTNKTVEYPHIYILKTSSSLLQLPIFYLYVLSVCYSNFKLLAKHILHALLFLFFFVLFKITNFSDFALDLFKVIGEIQYIAYIVAVFLVLNRYKKIYLENYSNANYAAYKWLFQITLLSCIAHSFGIIKWYLSSSSLQEYIMNINVLISISVLLITVFFVLKALYQPELFTGVNINLEPVKSIIVQQSFEKNNENSEHKNEYLRKLKQLMEEEKPYLDYELTLQKLANKIQVPEKDLSMLINHHLNKHFFDFINEYRIEDAKKLLSDPMQKELTVLEILYKVGFNSKSSFYTAFKKVSSMTPTEYRNSSTYDSSDF